MEAVLLDQYAALDSPVHRWPAGAKLAGLIALSAAMGLWRVPSPWLFAGFAVGLAGVAAASRLPPRFLLKKILLLEPFVLGIVAMTLFQPDGLHRFALALSRSTLCLFATVLFAATTPFSELLFALRRWRLPPLMVTTLALTYRYLFVLTDETLRMRRARAARTLVPGRAREWRAVSSVIARLFVRASDRAERIHSAMCARGWNG